jgi:hypothetical protein
MLTLRRTGLSSPACDVGRLYEDRHSKPEYRWFWSITVYVNPKLGPEWLIEIKHDGFRVIARKEGKRVRLYSGPAMI